MTLKRTITDIIDKIAHRESGAIRLPCFLRVHAYRH